MSARPFTRSQGITELVFAALVFAMMAYATKVVTRDLSGAQAAFVRFAVGLLVVTGHFVARGVGPRVERGDLLLLRGLFGGFAVLLYFLAIEHLPVGTATLLNYSAPVFTITFSALFLGETVRPVRLAAMALAGCGVILVIVGQGKALGGAYLWMGVGCLSALVSGAAVTSLRAARRTEGAWEVFGAFCGVGLLATFPFALHTWRAPAPTEWLLLVLIGVLAAVAQILMTHALKVVDAATGGVTAQITVVASMLLGTWLDHDPLTPTSLAGAALTIAGVSAATALYAEPAPARA